MVLQKEEKLNQKFFTRLEEKGAEELYTPVNILVSYNIFLREYLASLNFDYLNGIFRRVLE